MATAGTDFVLPSRASAAWFEIRALRHRIARFVRDLSPGAPGRATRASRLSGAPLLAEVRSPLWQDGRPDEFPLVAGKVENLRIALRGFDGIEVAPGKALSFWKQVGPPWRLRGFVEGREINNGCVVPAIAGGLCQMSNTLALAAERAGITLAERHAHTARIEGSGSNPEIGDATVFWNYVDLRLIAPFAFRIEAELTPSELVVRLRGHAGAADRRPYQPGLGDFLAPARGCLTCGESQCYRHGRFTRLATGARTAALLNGWTPEFEAFLQREHAGADRFAPWLRGGRRGVGWPPGKGPRIVTTGLARTVLLRFNPAGGARQAAVMRADRMLAAAYAGKLTPAHVEQVIDQSLLVELATRGLLGGRRYTVLAHSLPASEIERRLDAAHAAHPGAATLRDFRVGGEYAAREWTALRGAARIVTPHALVAKVLREGGIERVELLDWAMPPAKPRERKTGAPPVIGFPASALPRKGAIELAQAARRLGWKVRIGGALFPGEVDWSGIRMERVPLSDPEWLADVDIVALPAYVEHSPRMLLAALAAGIPVVASEACGLHTGAGRIVRAGDANALATALAGSLADG